MHPALAYAIGLAATLFLASFLTPSGWWKRPNMRALAVLAGGTWGLGGLVLWLAAAPAAAPALAAAAPRVAKVDAVQRYRVFKDLNLRAGHGVESARVAVIPEGAVVSATGARDGDWWHIEARLDGHVVSGWASSLWLRRTIEK